MPQLIWCQVLLCPDGMVFPRLTEDIQASLDAWQKNIVAAENVQDAADVKPVLILKRVQDVIINTCNTHEDITPEAFNAVFKKEIKNKIFKYT